MNSRASRFHSFLHRAISPARDGGVGTIRAARRRNVPDRTAPGLVEGLEGRTLFSTLSVASTLGTAADAAAAITSTFVPLPLISFEAGVVTINGTDERDDVTVENTTSNEDGWGMALVEVTHEDIITRETTVQTFNASLVQKIVFYGGGQQDVFDNNTYFPSEAYGGDGDDFLFGGRGDDILKGEQGNDNLDGADGADDLYGLQGNDTLTGDGGADYLEGGDDKDTMYGGEQRDTMYGGAGRDEMEGGGADDELHGDDGNDTLTGEGGDDELYGGEGDDTLVGEGGGDTLCGDAGGDTLEGGDDGDDLSGGDGDDYLVGGAGADGLFGERDDDVLDGGADGDTLEGGDGDDRLYGGGAGDTLRGGEGHDGRWGGDGVDNLTGGGGADRYLIHENKDANDAITNKTDEDVSVDLENADELRHGGDSYTAAQWAFGEVAEVDEALKQLVDRTGNNTLLRTSGGNELTLIRTGTPDVEAGEPTAWAWNLDGTGKIWLSDLVFAEWRADGADHHDSSDDEVHNVFLHEIGHNWDDENPDWGAWKDLSGWTDVWFVNWTHDDDAVFASDYASTHPRDDFAETFAAYFAFENGETFHSFLTDPVDSAAEIQEKIDFMDDWLETL